MALSARTETYGDTAGAVSVTVNVPGGTANGDQLFMWIGLQNASSYVVNSGMGAWTLLGSYTTNADKYYLYARIASSEPANYTPGFSGSTKARAVISCYYGGDFLATVTPDAVSNTAYRTSDANCRAASMASLHANSPLIYFGAVYSTTARTFTKPSVPTSGWVEDDDAGNVNSDFYLEVCSYIWAGVGATGIMSGTISSTATTKHAFAVALRPKAIVMDCTANAAFVLTGTAAGLLYNRAVVAENGAFTLTGTDVLLGKIYSMIADSGAFSLSGTNVDLLRPMRVMPAEVGAFSLSGIDVGLLRPLRIMPVDNGSFSLSGSVVDLLRAYVLIAAAGEFYLTGQDVVLDYGSGAPADIDSFIPCFRRRRR